MNSNNLSSSSFSLLLRDLTREFERTQPPPADELQFCSNWFQGRLEEQRTRARDALGAAYGISSRNRNAYEGSTGGRHSYPTTSHSLSRRASTYGDDESVDPLHRGSIGKRSSSTTFGRNSMGSGSPFGPSASSFPTHNFSTSPSFTNPFSSTLTPIPISPPSPSPGDFLHPPNSAIFARRTSVSAESIPIEDDALYAHNSSKPPYHPKTPLQLSRIRQSISTNFIFRDLDEEQETGVLNAMQEVRVGPGEEVINQGDVGEYFYVVESGMLDCYIRAEPGAQAPTPAPNLSDENLEGSPYPPPVATHPTYGTLVSICPPGSSFGELALMYGHPRAATVVSRVPSLLWALDRITFRTIILKAAYRRRTMYERFLEGVGLLQGLTGEERSKIADALVSRSVEDGERIVQQGEMGDTFFFVEEGEAVVTKRVPRRRAAGVEANSNSSANDDDTEEIVVGHLIKGDYFGELSLLRLAPRAATVSAVVRKPITVQQGEEGHATPTLNVTPSSPAVGTPPSSFPPPAISADISDPATTTRFPPKLKVAALDAPAFTRLLGPLREIMERRAGESYLM
ncbi:cyclic nucleotide-binding-like protein [Rhodocollybia butyracea]|uniref:cAMP-dependent protein kinase regulatory subunit n=1 Tax=Rhodocollybia butyracea TaxID=206335 RepID=A0A9P5UE92_9AGAR|nr:cyclic nucleotide-binding-like protein [Rhodocollybia butyracea]